MVMPSMVVEYEPEESAGPVAVGTGARPADWMRNEGLQHIYICPSA